MAHRELPTKDDMSAIFKAWLKWLPLYEDKPIETIRAYSQGVRRVVAFAIADTESTMYRRRAAPRSST